MSAPLVRRYLPSDLDTVASVHEFTFPRQERSREWIDCNSKAFPRTQLFVAEVRGRVVGFAMWTQKAGFRSEAVVELEQIGVIPQYQRRGIGEALLRNSLTALALHLAERHAVVKSVLVTTRADNQAQRLYRRVLGADVTATVTDLYSADEVVMIARDVA